MVRKPGQKLRRAGRRRRGEAPTLGTSPCRILSVDACAAYLGFTDRRRDGAHRDAFGADTCAQRATNPVPNRNDHHHAGAGRQLAHAEQMDQLRIGQPPVNVDREGLHFRECRHTTTDGEQREIGKHTRKNWQLAHRAISSFVALRGRCHRIARRPTTTKVTKTDR